jgi:hypothetical protein
MTVQRTCDHGNYDFVLHHFLNIPIIWAVSTEEKELLKQTCWRSVLSLFLPKSNSLEWREEATRQMLRRKGRSEGENAKR